MAFSRDTPSEWGARRSLDQRTAAPHITLALMPAWRRHLLEQFPEFRHQPESWSLVEASSALSSLLEKATSDGDLETARRVVLYVLWAHKQAPQDEGFFHFCVSVLRTTAKRERLRSALAYSLSEEAFRQLASVFHYLFEKKEFAVLEQDVRLKSRGAFQ